MAVRRPVGTFDRTRKNVNRLRNMANLGSAGAYDNPGDEIAAGDAALARAAIDSERRRPLHSRRAIEIPYAPGQSPEEQAEAARAAQEADLARIEEQYPATTYEGAGIDRRTGKSYDPIEVMLAQLLGAEPGGLPDLTKLQQMDADMLELVTTSLADAQDRRLMLQQAEAEAAYMEEDRQRQRFLEDLAIAEQFFPQDSIRGAAYMSDLARQYEGVAPAGLGEATDPRPRLNRIVSRGVGSVVDALSGRQPLGRSSRPAPLTPEEAAEEAGLVKGPGLIDAFGEAIGLPESMSRSRRTAEEVVDEIIGYGEQAQGFYKLQDDIIRYIEEGLSRSEIISQLNRTAREFEIDSETIAFLRAMYEPMMG